MKKTVFTLLSGKKLNESQFCRYISKKIEKTAKEFKLRKEKQNKVYCLDDAAIEIMSSLMSAKKAKLQKSIFIHCLKKELELYAKLRKIQFNFIENKGLKLKVSNMLDQLEKKHPEIKYSIYRAQED